MLFCVFARLEQLNPATERTQRVAARHRVHILQRHAVIRAAWLIHQCAQLRLDVFPGVAQRHIFFLSIFPRRPYGPTLAEVSFMLPLAIPANYFPSARSMRSNKSRTGRSSES